MSDLVEALHTFVRLADRPSFSAVAAETGASHTTIARRIDVLEQHFGVRLLNRTTRRLALTDEGERLLGHARGLLEALDTARAEVAGDGIAARGLVRVGVTTALGLHYASRIGGLLARHPGIEVAFSVSDWPAEMGPAGQDLAIRVGSPAEERLVVRPLGRLDRVLVAAPAYVAAHGVPEKPADLAAHACVAYAYGPAAPRWDIAGTAWPVACRFRADSSEAALRAVLGGAGIGLAPAIQVAGDLACGALVRLLPDHAIAPLRVSVVHLAQGPLPVRTRAVRDFLIASFPQTPP